MESADQKFNVSKRSLRECEVEKCYELFLS